MRSSKLGKALSAHAPASVMNMYIQRRREPLQFPLPVAQQGGRTENQHRLERLLRRSCQCTVQQAGNHLNCLSQPHVIGKAYPEAQPAERGQPLVTPFLIRPQRSVQALRHRAHRKAAQNIAVHQ
ncbi:hypothetical protein D3C73_1112300 [compost metagenome]